MAPLSQEQFMEKQGQLCEAIAGGAFDVMPEGWTAVTVSIKAAADGTDMTWNMSNNKGESGLAVPNEELMATGRELYLLGAEQGHAWLEANLEFYEQDNGNWGMNASFKYPE
jgi:hypothetical protein